MEKKHVHFNQIKGDAGDKGMDGRGRDNSLGVGGTRLIALRCCPAGIGSAAFLAAPVRDIDLETIEETWVDFAGRKALCSLAPFAQDPLAAGIGAAVFGELAQPIGPASTDASEKNEEASGLCRVDHRRDY